MANSPHIPPTPDERAYAADADAEASDHLPGDGADPIQLFEAWLADAGRAEVNDPNAMVLATVDASGAPNARCLLLKDVDSRGFTFFTNAGSVKGDELAAAPVGALCFHWKSLRRQVRVRGPVGELERADVDAYFATRARASRIGAWASQQSRPLESREALRAEVERFEQEFDGQDVPCPPTWTGYRLAPLEIEFWRDRPYRLHDRLRYDRADLSDAWRFTRLFP
ncbi:MAG: pyridoxamine 5'-phosphate oxidase [Pseudomonadota bacterium]